jgi:hypothetical protein
MDGAADLAKNIYSTVVYIKYNSAENLKGLSLQIWFVSKWYPLLGSTAEKVLPFPASNGCGSVPLAAFQ